MDAGGRRVSSSFTTSTASERRGLARPVGFAPAGACDLRAVAPDPLDGSPRPEPDAPFPPAAARFADLWIPAGLPAPPARAALTPALPRRFDVSVANAPPPRPFGALPRSAPPPFLRRLAIRPSLSPEPARARNRPGAVRQRLAESCGFGPIETRRVQMRPAFAARMRIGPRAVPGSTTLPPCVMSTTPRAASRRAARRAGSINARHVCSSVAAIRRSAGASLARPAAATWRAASLGQIVPPARSRSRPRMAASSRPSTSRTPRPRHADEQYFTRSQSRAHFRRQVISRPQATQVLTGTRSDCLRRAIAQC